MQWVQSADWEQGIADLGRRLTSKLSKGQRVLWLLSGGSNIAASVRVMQGLPDEITHGLTLSLIDERYGPPGHADSNWEQLQRGGLATKQARTLPVLQPGLNLAQTRDRYDTMIKTAFTENDVVIGQLGIGDDGHIAGILPHSVATGSGTYTGQESVMASPWIIAYHGLPFDRLSLSFAALQRLTTAYVFAFGPAKRPALHRLYNDSLPLIEQPAQILKKIPETYLYNDQIGGNI